MISIFREHTNRLVQQKGPYLDQKNSSLAIMALGLSGECGEVTDEIKKILGHGKPVDREKILNELGDVLFYTDRVLAAFGFTLEDAMQSNIDKLNKRYPNGFDSAEKKFGFSKEEGAL